MSRTAKQKTKQPNGNTPAQIEIADAGIFALLTGELLLLVIELLNLFSNVGFQKLLSEYWIVTIMFIIVNLFFGAIAYRNLSQGRNNKANNLNRLSIFFCAIIVILLVAIGFEIGKNPPPPYAPDPPSMIEKNEKQKQEVAVQGIMEETESEMVEQISRVRKEISKLNDQISSSTDDEQKKQWLIEKNKLDSFQKQIRNTTDYLKNYCDVGYSNREFDIKEYENCINKIREEFCELMREYQNGIFINICN